MNTTLKDSGIAFVGVIPASWSVHRLGGIGEFASSGIDKKIVEGEPLVQIINYTDVYGNEIGELREREYMTVSAPPWRIAANLTAIGDAIITPSSETIEDIGVAAIVMDDLHNTAYSYHVLRYRLSNIVHLNYRKYLLNNYALQNYYSSRATGSIRKTLTRGDLKGAQVSVPPLQEQKRIALYLDTRRETIVRLIALEEEAISRLQEYKQSLITEAVTKGLDPTVPMKDSGVEWLGDVPVYAATTTIGKMFATTLGKMLSSDPREGYTKEPYLSAINVHFEGVELSDLKEMWFSENEKPTYAVRNGDLIVVEGGAGAGGAAIVENLSENDRVFVQNSVHIVRPNHPDASARFLYYTLYSLVNRKYIDFVCNKATIPHYTKEKLRSTPLVHFGCEVQQQIVNYLDSTTGCIDKIIASKQQKILSLRSYKQSLIFEYVTGKKRVPMEGTLHDPME